MAIFLPSEIETSVSAENGMVCIMQIDKDDETVEIWLTVRQFEEILNHSKHIINEARGVEK